MQLVSVTATASASTRACVRSVKTLQLDDNARAVSLVSMATPPTEAAASVSIHRPFPLPLNHPVTTPASFNLSIFFTVQFMSAIFLILGAL